MRHTLHLKAPGNWINDPNGFIYYRGKYHLFYQYFPYAPVWGTMHWGHAVSTDLVHWEHLGVALFPTKYEDQNGCFSGSALEHDGKLNLYYTGIHYDKPRADNIHTCIEERFASSQLMLISEDGETFDNFESKRTVIPVIEDDGIGDSKDTRDPKVWEENGKFYMVLGSTKGGEEGRLLFYESEDALDWRYAFQVSGKQFGRILECPDLFSLEEKHVFIGSPMYIEEKTYGYEHHAVCARAEFCPEEGKFELSGSYQYIDYGFDLYAPQTNVDREGRRVLIGWMRMPKAVKEPGHREWIGMMGVPRVVKEDGEHICFQMHPETDRYLSRRIGGREELFRQKEIYPYRAKAVLSEGESLDIGGYKIRMEGGAVKTDRSEVFGSLEGYHLMSETPRIGGKCSLDIIVDPNLIEIFINDGEYVISNVVYGLGSYIDGHVEQIFAGDE